MTLTKRLKISCLVNLFRLQVAYFEENANDYFEDKLNNALKVVEQISNKLDNIYNVITTKSESKLIACDVS